jgi:hypothetical protein
VNKALGNKTFVKVAIACLTLLSFDAMANKRCGFGSKLFGHSKGIVSQTFENATNRVSTGVYSISFGTSGCKNNGMLLFDPIGKNDRLDEQLVYANANYEELVTEMAAGSGETLTAFAEIFGCRGEAAATFGSTTRASYSKIVDHDQMEPEQMLYNLRRTVHESESLRGQCDAV